MPPGASPPSAWLTRRASRAGWVAPATWVGHCGVGALPRPRTPSPPDRMGSRLDRSFFGGRTLPCRQVSPLRNVNGHKFWSLPCPPKHDSCSFTAAEKAHIRSLGGATICCLYLSGERSRPFPARVAPPPFAPLRGVLCQADA